MKLSALRINNFQSFGPYEAEIRLEDDITYLLGPNGSGKTAVLQALARLFSPIQSQRTVQVSDFHRPMDKINYVEQDWLDTEPELWIEAEFEGSEPTDDINPSNIVFFKQMSMERSDSDRPRMVVRLTANLDSDGIVEEKIEYVRIKNGERSFITMPRTDRNKIAVYYLPARRDPSDQISYTASSMMGKILRATEWKNQRREIAEKFSEISDSIIKNTVIELIGKNIEYNWKRLHRGNFLTSPSITFGNGELESILRQLSLDFNPTHTGSGLPFDNLSDGQKSLLYFSIIMAWISLCRKAMNGEANDIDLDRLNPPVCTIIAVEEPENSLAPHYLGRISKQLRNVSNIAQSIIATHSPAVVKRVEPSSIRFLRLNSDRNTSVKYINIPENGVEAAKYVNEAIKAYPELYFSRLVILGEGDSEMLVLPRILASSGIVEDEMSVSVVPLGGRHVNYFWRLLNDLEIPHLTLLDLDYGRHQGGYGRIKYALEQLCELGNFSQNDNIFREIQEKRNSDIYIEDSYFETLEEKGVFFSQPIDLDMMMLEAYRDAYEIIDDEVKSPNVQCIKRVLGDSAKNTLNLPDFTVCLFDAYRKRFKGNSKPVTHLYALARIDDDRLMQNLPAPLKKLVEVVDEKLKELPE
ncbi:ATP-dependent nuclease [Rothia mucilaginosa]|uniref:ATP-dependent nuclease n=1 Tax=Rothia mucilaginosa TaxID=43675 RepID=UPI0026F2A45F|nr:AAA family ATPase [Rothia mucilaginosa]